MISAAPSERRARTLLADIAVGLLAGLVATQVTNLAQGPLQQVTPDSVRRQERRLRPGASSSLVAARKAAFCLDCSPNRRSMGLLGKAIHFGIGMAWGPVYGLLRRHGGMGPFGTALAAASSPTSSMGRQRRWRPKGSAAWWGGHPGLFDGLRRTASRR